MAFKTGTIRLEAARNIFSGIRFEEIKIEEKTVGYRAYIGDRKVATKNSLTALCTELWRSHFEVKQDG